MLKQKSLSLILILASSITCNNICTKETAIEQRSLLEYISHQYLTTLFGEEKVVEVTPIDESKLSYIEKIKYNINKKYDAQKQALTPRDTQKIAFDLVTAKSIFETTIIDKSFIEKLEVISTQQSLLSIVFNNISTTMGKAYTSFTFCHPINDVNILSNRQQAVAHISENRQLIHFCNASFKEIANNENMSLQPWHAKDSINADLLKSFYFSLLKPLNTNTMALETYNKGLNVLNIINGTVGIPLTMLLANYYVHKFFGIKLTLKDTAQNMWNRLMSPDVPLFLKFLENYSLLLQPLQAYQSAYSIKSTGEVSNHLQSELMASARHIKELKKLSSLINKNKDLLKNLPSLQPLAEFNNPKKHSANLNKLLGMLLDTNTFKGEPSIWSITGRILAAHTLMEQVKDELAPVFAAAGELEMYVTLAQLYAEQQGKNATYCMANFIESSTPVIEAQGFWNPFINPNSVVINDVTFNSEHSNSILTGPNTGGKSTVIKGVMLNVLMAQTFGMTPAQSFTLTPFAKLNCFMNIADDIATGASLFKSEVMRAKELSTMISNLKENEFSFVIIDEVFTGTSPVEGEMAALRFAKHLTTFPSSIAVIATHYPKMTTLEQETEGKFYNHHVEILRNEDGSLNRTFKLKNGPTFVNVALDILEEEGLII
jgi:DNA mismatch repair protein MutS